MTGQSVPNVIQNWTPLPDEGESQRQFSEVMTNVRVRQLMKAVRELQTLVERLMARIQNGVWPNEI